MASPLASFCGTGRAVESKPSKASRRSSTVPIGILIAREREQTMKASVLPVLALLAFVAFAACGGSSSSEDDLDAAGGAECASDEDCGEVLPKCSQAGKCVDVGWCDTDADCPEESRFCDTVFHQCGPCRTDADCPTETPVCAPSWEYGFYCAECRIGQPSACPSGTICTPHFFFETGGGQCEAPNCASAPGAKPCVACINEHAAVCLGEGDECEGVHLALEACYAAESPGWMSGDCPTGLLWSVLGCTPAACFDEAYAFDGCLLGCAAANALCDASGEGDD
jgi:hypothetical protein